LSIRPATPQDVESTWVYRREPSVGQWITTAPDTFEDYTEMFLHRPRLAKTLLVELQGRVIGDLMLSIGDAWGQTEVQERVIGVQAEVGWSFDPRYGGCGYATESVAELLRLCFEELGLRRVTGSCFADNVASWRLMERLGMRRETHAVKESLHRSGEWMDAYDYAMLADEWRAGTGGS
jgi:RimJ/RimL family protein N-acetyltransferase